MKENIFKGIFSVAVAGFAAYFQQILIPVIILFLVMIADYVTGMTKAYVTAKVCSKTGAIGVIKKLCYLIVVCVGMCVDWILQSVLSQVGIQIDGVFAFGLLVTIWLIINELISILENLALVGVPLPSFLVKIVHKLKVAVESKADDDKESGE